MDSPLPPAHLQPPQVLRELALTFKTHVPESGIQRQLLNLVTLSLVPCRPKEGRGQEGSLISRALTDMTSRRRDWGFLGKQKSSVLKPCSHQSDSAPQNTRPACTRAHDIKVIFLVAGKARLSLPLPWATCWSSSLFTSPPHCGAPSAIRSYLYR